MVTFDPQGGYGHPDHIRAHEAATMAYYTAGDPRIFPEVSGAAAWKPLKLYWGAFTRGRFRQAVEAAQKMGVELSIPMQEIMKRGIPEECVTTRIDVSEFVDLKLDALACHASQLDPKNVWQRIPREVRREGMKVEMLVRAESRVAPLQEIETDLFAGIE